MKKIFLLLICLLSIFIVGCNQQSQINNNNNDDENKESLQYIISTGLLTDSINDIDNGIYVANKVIPTTVEIKCTVNFSYTQRYMTNPFGNIVEKTVDSSQSCQATGFVINEEGYILTNAHVITVENEENYTNLEYTSYNITFNYADSDVLFNGSVIDSDVSLDLAILKMDTSQIKELQYATFFDLTNPENETFDSDNANKLYYGEKCYAIGNANGYGLSITEGIVSAPVRYFYNEEDVIVSIQTDAAINSGNSGGPLCNKYGHVIGVNSFKIVTSTSESLGYAIPVYVILDFIDSVNDENNLSIKYYTTTIRSF